MIVEKFPGGGRRQCLGSTTKAASVAAVLPGEDPPTGMRFLSSGAYKDAYTDGKFVYKTGNGDEGDIDFANETLGVEFQTCEALAAEGITWVAPTSMYVFDGVPVLVQPLYERPKNLSVKQMEAANEASYRLNDMYAGNWLCTKSGKVRVIDFAGHGD